MLIYSFDYPRFACHTEQSSDALWQFEVFACPVSELVGLLVRSFVRSSLYSIHANTLTWKCAYRQTIVLSLLFSLSLPPILSTCSHGGGKRCTFAGCTKSAVGGSNLCTSHGGGKRCAVEGCNKSAQSSTKFCVKHGGGKKCAHPNCEKVARGRTSYCAAVSDQADMAAKRRRLSSLVCRNSRFLLCTTNRAILGHVSVCLFVCFLPLVVSPTLLLLCIPLDPAVAWWWCSMQVGRVHSCCYWKTTALPDTRRRSAFQGSITDRKRPNFDGNDDYGDNCFERIQHERHVFD